MCIIPDYSDFYIIIRFIIGIPVNMFIFLFVTTNAIQINSYFELRSCVLENKFKDIIYISRVLSSSECKYLRVFLEECST